VGKKYGLRQGHHRALIPDDTDGLPSEICGRVEAILSGGLGRPQKHWEVRKSWEGSGQKELWFLFFQ
jgi:hypothetical protein